MQAKEKMIEILNTTFDRLTNSVNIDKQKSQDMTNTKHRELVEKYAKVLSRHYVGKLANLCSSLLIMEFDNEEKEKNVYNKFQNKMDELVNNFPKDFNATMKSVKKYFGHAYNDDCLQSVVAESFSSDLNTQKNQFFDWTINLNKHSTDNQNDIEKASA